MNAALRGLESVAVVLVALIQANSDYRLHEGNPG